jgi:hypothetical protein
LIQLWSARIYSRFRTGRFIGLPLIQLWSARIYSRFRTGRFIGLPLIHRVDAAPMNRGTAKARMNPRTP